MSVLKKVIFFLNALLFVLFARAAVTSYAVGNEKLVLSGILFVWLFVVLMSFKWAFAGQRMSSTLHE